MIIEVEFKDLQLASWGLRIASSCSSSLKAWASGEQWCKFQFEGRRLMYKLKQSGRESSLLLSSIQAFNWLDEAHPH